MASCGCSTRGGTDGVPVVPGRAGDYHAVTGLSVAHSWVVGLRVGGRVAFRREPGRASPARAGGRARADGARHASWTSSRRVSTSGSQSSSARRMTCASAA
eukprot:3048282-Prymnesium_polylepis.1